VSVYVRAGIAHEQGAPLGAAVDTAKNTTTNAQAAAAGRLFAGANLQFAPAQTQLNAFGLPATDQTPQAQQRASLFDPTKTAPTPTTAWVQRYVGDPIMAFLRAAGKPLEKVGDYYEATDRLTRRGQDSDDAAREFLGATLYRIPGVGALDPAWREEWAKTQEAEASVAQTLWLSVANPSSSPDQAYRLLDDPQARAPRRDPETGQPLPSEREEYFGSGPAKWVTGIGDAAFSIFADPLVIGGKGISVARKAAQTIKASDVAAAAGEMPNLTRGARRVNATVNRVVDASERVRAQARAGQAGGYADLADTKWFQQTADAGAIPYFMKRIDDEVDDTLRISMKRDALFAGMGDRGALARLEQKNADLALELQNLTGPNRATAIEGILSRRDYSHLDNLRAVDEDAWLDKVIESHAEEIRKTRDAISRVQQVGNPAGLTGEALQATSGVGELSRFVGVNGGGRDVLRVAKTIHRGAGLPRIHVLTGRHIPGTFRLSDPDAFTSFNASLDEARNMFRKAPRAQEARRMLDRLADDFALAHGAADPAASRATRRAVVDRFNRVMEQNLAVKYAPGDKVKQQQIISLVREIRNRRTAEMVHIKERSYRAKRSDGIGYHQDNADDVFTWDTQALKDDAATPFDATQFEDLVSLPSYKAIDRRLSAMLSKESGGLAGLIRLKGQQAWELTEEGIGAFNDLWKFGALFRLGYPIRTQVDSQARLLAELGALRYAMYLGKASANLAYNAKRIPLVEAEHAARVAQARMRLEALDDLDELTPALRAERERLEQIVASPAPKAPAGPTVRRGKTELARFIGKGEGRGNAYRSTAEFERESKTVDAHDSTLGLLADATRAHLADLRKSMHVQTVPGSNPLWEKSYLDMVNKHVRNSHPLTMILGGADDTEVARWYRETDVGRAQWAGFNGRYDDPLDLVRTQREQLDTLLPEGEIRSAVMGGPLTENQVKYFWRDQASRPGIPAEMLEEAGGNKAINAANRLRSQFFKYASEMPETMMARHPFYAARKQEYLRRAIANAGGDADALTLAQYNQAAKRASVLARKDVSKYLFDTSQRSNLAHSLRFLSPFYSAWSDTMRKWALIAGENPHVLPLIPKAFQSFNSGLVVVDNDGNRILKNGDVVNADGEVIRKSTDFTEGYILIGLPEWISSWTTGRAGASDTVKISKGSLNVIFQGDPFWLPGPGPMAAVPANEIALKAFPEAWDDQNAGGALLRYLLPFGLDQGQRTTGIGAVDRAIDQSTPMWAQNLRTLLAGDFSDDRFAQTYAMLMAEEVNAERNGESERRSQAELEKLVMNRTRNWYLLRVLGSEAPFSTQPTGRLEYWRQEWQRYQRQYGGEARDRFYADYPDYFEASISLSANEAGITATDESWNEASKYMDQIRANKEYGWMWVGAANLAPGFDAGVYTAQKDRGLRGTKDPIEAFNDLQVNKGWYDYQRLQGALQLKLDERKGNGYSGSITAASNADLKQIRDEALAELTRENPQWASAYEKGGQGKSALEFLRTAAQAVQDNPELGNRSDFKTLGEYLIARQAMQAKLAERSAAGGSASLDAQANADLKEIWDDFMTELVNRDLGFQQMYNRGGLDRDDLTGG